MSNVLDGMRDNGWISVPVRPYYAEKTWVVLDGAARLLEYLLDAPDAQEEWEVLRKLEEDFRAGAMGVMEVVAEVRALAERGGMGFLEPRGVYLYQDLVSDPELAQEFLDYCSESEIEPGALGQNHEIAEEFLLGTFGEQLVW